MEGQLGKLGTIFFQFEFDIFAHEEVRIRKTRAEDVFVALADDVYVDVVAVSYRNEMRQEICRTACSPGRDLVTGKVTLMFLHDRDQYITRQGQIFPVKFTHDGGGHFDQISYFIEQSIVNNSLAADQEPRLV